MLIMIRNWWYSDLDKIWTWNAEPKLNVLTSVIQEVCRYRGIRFNIWQLKVIMFQIKSHLLDKSPMMFPTFYPCSLILFIFFTTELIISTMIVWLRLNICCFGSSYQLPLCCKSTVTSLFPSIAYTLINNDKHVVKTELMAGREYSQVATRNIY